MAKVNYYDDYGFLSKFAESGGELAAVKQRLDYQAMSGYGTYEGTNGAPEVVSAVDVSLRRRVDGDVGDRPLPFRRQGA